jgi:hypothetical protein
MIDFSIQALIAPVVPPVERYFDKVTNFIMLKNPKLDREQVDHDVKVLMFNATTALIASAVSSAYFRRIALVTAVALIILFYLVRRIIDETFHPQKAPSETPTIMGQVREMGQSLLPKRGLQIPIAVQPKSLKEKFQEFFRQGDDIVIGRIVLLKTTHYPMPTVISMFLTRRS